MIQNSNINNWIALKYLFGTGSGLIHDVRRSADPGLRENCRKISGKCILSTSTNLTWLQFFLSFCCCRWQTRTSCFLVPIEFNIQENRQSDHSYRLTTNIRWWCNSQRHRQTTGMWKLLCIVVLEEIAWIWLRTDKITQWKFCTVYFISNFRKLSRHEFVKHLRLMRTHRTHIRKYLCWNQ